MPALQSTRTMNPVNLHESELNECKSARIQQRTSFLMLVAQSLAECSAPSSDDYGKSPRQIASAALPSSSPPAVRPFGERQASLRSLIDCLFKQPFIGRSVLSMWFSWSIELITNWLQTSNRLYKNQKLTFSNQSPPTLFTFSPSTWYDLPHSAVLSLVNALLVYKYPVNIGALSTACERFGRLDDCIAVNCIEVKLHRSESEFD